MTENSNDTRLGFHYYPDTYHFRYSDLETWLPRLQQLGASWITLYAHPSRAIPEFFLKSLLDEGIKPVIHIPIKLGDASLLENADPIFKAYANWGVEYVAVYDRPNVQQSWKQKTWLQTKLVERFLDIYLPTAELLVKNGLKPVFPPLEPGGDFWDTVFLKTTLESIQRRDCQPILDNLVLGAYAFTSGRKMNWGAGGPAQWPTSLPYATPVDGEDQKGFFIFEWYQAQARETINRELPVILLKAGCTKSDNPEDKDFNLDEHAYQNLTLAKWLLNDSYSELGKCPATIVSANFWVLATANNHESQQNAWYPETGIPLPVVDAFKNFTADNHKICPSCPANQPLGNDDLANELGHYLLLPKTSCMEKDNVFQAAEEYGRKKKAAMGWQIDQAYKAHRVTIIGERKWLSEKVFEQFKDRDCMIEEVYGIGTKIAFKLSTL